MKRVKMFGVILCSVCALSFTGCNRGFDLSAQTGDGSLDVATSARNVIEDSPVELDAGESDMSDVSADDTTEVSSVLQQEKNPDPTTYGFQYSYYLDYLNNGENGGQNNVFSPEALHSAFSLYEYFIDSEDRLTIYNGLTSGRNYLGFQDTNGFKIINSVWQNKNIDLEVSESVYYDAYLHEFDPSDVKSVCGKFILDSSGSDAIKMVPFLSEDDDLKTFSFVNFDAMWFGGEKMRGYNGKFVSADGTEFENVPTMSSLSADGHDYSTYYSGINAHACKMKYDNGFELVVVLPDRDKSISDVNILDFINGYDSVVPMNSNVYFQMPIFDMNSHYNISISDLGLGDIKLDKNITASSNVISTVQINNFGIKNVSDTVKMDEKNIDPDSVYYMVCNRPFIFYVKDTVNWDIVYIGVMNTI